MGAEQAIVEVLSSATESAGLGFVVPGGFVLTCAHVVNTVLGRDIREIEEPVGATIELRYRYALEEARATATVAHWAPSGGRAFEGSDLAVLALDAPPPEGVSSATLAAPADAVAGSRVHMFGPAPKRPSGVIVPATVLGRLPDGRTQVNQEVFGSQRAVRGFSGGPVWLTDDQGSVAGMLTAVGVADDARDVYLLDVVRLMELWPQGQDLAGPEAELETLFLDTLLQAPDLDAIDIPPLGRVQLVDLYVPPELVPRQTGASDARRAHDEATAGEGATPATPTEAVDRFKRLVVVGAPGTGKTTVLRHLARTLAEAEPGGPLPMFVSLGAYASRADGLDLLSFALRDRYQAVLDHRVAGTLADLTRVWNREGRLVFLLDGLDEVPEDERRRVVDEIAQLQRFVVTSRPLQQVLVGQRPEATLEIAPLSSEAVAQYVWNWEASGLSGDAFDARRLLERLTVDHRLGELSQTLQMLMLLCWLEGSAGPRRSPSTRAGLLARAVRLLIETATERSGVAPLDREVLPLRLRGWLRELAWETLEATTAGRGRMTVETLVESAARYDGVERAGILVRLARWSGLIVPAPGGDDEVQFLHLVFHEFLAGEALATSADLSARVERLRWRSDASDVLRMAAAVLDARGEHDRVQELLRVVLDETNTDLFRCNWRSAAFCLADVEDIEQAAGPLLAEMVQQLLRGASEWWARDEFTAALACLRAGTTSEVLIEALTASDRYTRWAAAEALAGLGDPSATEALCAALARETWPPVRAAVVDALGRTGDDSVVDLLTTAAREPDDGWTRSAVGVALGRLDAVDALAGLLESDEDLANDVVVGALPHLQAPAADRIRSELAGRGIVVAFRPDNPYTAPLSPAAVDVLLASDDLDDQRRGLDALRDRADWAALVRLCDVLLDPDPDLREAAAAAIAGLDDDDAALQTAVRLLANFMLDADEGLAQDAATALVELWVADDPRAGLFRLLDDASSFEADQDTVTQFVQLLQHEATDLRGAACLLLGLLHADAGEAMVPVLHDVTAVNRWIATSMLGVADDELARPDQLDRLAREDDDVVLSATARAVALNGVVDARAALTDLLADENPVRRRIGAESLGLLGGEGLAATLLPMLHDDDPDVRLAVAEALGELGDKAACSALVELLATGDEGWVIAGAMTATAALGCREATPHLLRFLDVEDVHVQGAAVEALATLGDPAAGPRLAELLDLPEHRRAELDVAAAVGRVADDDLVLATAERLAEADLIGDLVRLASSVVRRDAALAEAVAAAVEPHVARVLLTANVVEIESADTTSIGILGGPEDVDPEADDWLGRWEAIEVLRSQRSGDAVPVLAQLLRDEHPVVARAAADALGSLGRNDEVAAEVVHDAVGTALRPARADGTLLTLLDNLLDEPEPSRIWLLGRLDLLDVLLPAYLGGRDHLRPLLWDVADRHQLRLLRDGTVVLPSGDVVACEEAVARLGARL